ncbi:hypothetical protein SDC9_174728 [bioreactor metagenome]|uniref:Uncharacterized protein n=1 Tax=bioreactor metagenome TaxID=1076179 RepID=A0A645GK72_9ZZZZ
MTLLAANILIVDDEQAIADLVEVYLKNENYPEFCSKNRLKSSASTALMRTAELCFFGILMLYIRTLFVVLQNFFNFRCCHNLIPKVNAENPL